MSGSDNGEGLSPEWIRDVLAFVRRTDPSEEALPVRLGRPVQGALPLSPGEDAQLDGRRHHDGLSLLRLRRAGRNGRSWPQPPASPSSSRPPQRATSASVRWSTRWRTRSTPTRQGAGGVAGALAPSAGRALPVAIDIVAEVRGRHQRCPAGPSVAEAETNGAWTLPSRTSDERHQPPGPPGLHACTSAWLPSSSAAPSPTFLPTL